MKILFEARPDAKGRICLGQYAKGISKYKITVDDETGNIILEPFAEVPARELWLWQNKNALNAVMEGIRQSQAGQVIDSDGFTQYLNDE